MDSQPTTIKKMLLNATLMANLDTLKVYAPELFEIFKNYKPLNSAIIVDEVGNVNLFNNDKCVYECEPQLFCQAQVALFLKNPLCFNFKLESLKEEEALYEHARLIKQLNEKCKQEAPEENDKVSDEVQFDFVCMIGGGLGYQIEQLFKQKQIFNFLLCEPSNDVFFAMLHGIELRPLIEHCKALGGEFIFQVGGGERAPFRAILNLLQRKGPFNISRMFLFKHYDSDTSDGILDTIRQYAHRLTSGWGFMEDEIIGLRHTFANLQLGYKVCKNTVEFDNSESQRPVFLVGNGPSLDYSLDFLINNQKDIIIISCGTALRALLKHGIKPDVHVEMERPVSILSFIENIEEQQKNSELKLSDIQIIAFNTVYPEILKKFKTPLIFPKHKDAGGKYIEQLDELSMYTSTLWGNPTCTNMGMALSLTLGFENIYMIGTDYGYVNTEHHHSKHSTYYDENFAEEDVTTQRMTEDMTRKGNFRESVYTNAIFDSSRGNIEALLQTKPSVKVYNCSDGASIMYTEPKHIEAVELETTFGNKDLFMSGLLDSAFSNKQLGVHNLNSKMDQDLHILKTSIEQLFLITKKNVESREELTRLFSIQHELLIQLRARKEYQVNYWMLQGSFKYMQACIMTNSYAYKDLNERNEYMNYCLEKFEQHIWLLYEKLVTSYDDMIKN